MDSARIDLGTSLGMAEKNSYIKMIRMIDERGKYISFFVKL